MIINIERDSFDSSEIAELYPAAIVKTGFEDETTQVSLEWLEIESKGKVELEGYGIFIHLKNEDRYSYRYRSREELDIAISKLAMQLQK
jgi:hypothetical protein